MHKPSWIVMTSLLWAAQLQAQPAPTPATKPAAAPTAPAAAPAAPAAPAAAPSAAPAAKPAAPAAPTARSATPAASTDKSVEWSVDPAHSRIGFTARHIVSKVGGQFKKFSGVVRADPKTGKIVSLEATADTASIDTGIEKRDAHLRGDDFFNAEKYPQLKLVAKSLKWSGNKFTASAELTIRDVTKTVPFKGELLGIHTANFGQGEHLRAGYEATAKINRKDFGLKWSMVTEGIAVVGDEVELNLAAELMYTPPSAAAAAAPAAAPAPSAAAATTPTGSAPAATPAKPAAPPPAAPAAKPAAPPAPAAPKPTH